nr:MAG: hypothetical protein DIU78_10725 [Pseudomonadota bacterium]
MAVSGLTIACGGTASSVRTERLDASTYALECQAPLSRCLVEADTLCRGAPYVVLTGHDRRDLYGSSDGPSQVEVRSSTATIRCDPGRRFSDGSATPGVEKLLPPSAGVATASPSGSGASPPAGAPPAAPSAPSSSAAAAVSAAPPPSADARVCIPGATQQCVGPGACSGGQACLPDGSGFGPCDCGTATGSAGAPTGKQN